MTLTQVWEIQTTLATEEAAAELAKKLVEARLAACVQISGPIRSLYYWENQLQNECEWSLRIKTNDRFLDKCMTQLEALHPYETPEILASPVQRVGSKYHTWLEETLATSSAAKVESWHIQIQGFPADAVHGGSVDLVGRSCEQWSLPTGPKPLSVSFEYLAESIAAWPGMFFEMDGSFVWVSLERDANGKPLWQLDGMIYDRGDSVQFVELKGRCDHQSWKEFIGALSVDGTTPSHPLAIHLISQSAWVLEADFRGQFL